MKGNCEFCEEKDIEVIYITFSPFYKSGAYACNKCTSKIFKRRLKTTIGLTIIILLILWMILK